MTLKDLEAVNDVLHTTIDVITRTVESLYQKAQELDKKQQQLQTTNEDPEMAAESQNQTIQLLCGQPKDVSTRKVEAVTVRSVKCHNVSGTSNVGQTAAFRRSVLLPPSGSHLGMVLCHWLYVQSSVMVLSRLCALNEGHTEVCVWSLFPMLLPIEP